MESKVGRMGSSFYVLFIGDKRAAFLWERALHTDMPNVPPRQRLELYEVGEEDRWIETFEGCTNYVDVVNRLRFMLFVGEVTLRRLARSPSGVTRQLVFDGQQIVVDTPPESAEAVDIRGLKFPKSLAWSNKIVKERQ